MGLIKTVEQERSGFALECVKSILNEDYKANYRSLAKKFPMMVLRNGLLQSIAFLEAKGRNHHKALLDHINEYLLKHSPLNIKIEGRLSEYLSKNVDVNEYRNITMDVLAFIKWLGRYAEAMIEEEKNE